MTGWPDATAAAGPDPTAATYGRMDEQRPGPRAALFASRKRAWLAAAAAAAAVVVAAGAVIALQPTSAAGKAGSPDRHASHSPKPKPVVPLQLLQVTPAGGSTGVNGGAQIKIAFSQPLTAGSPLPVLTPKITGSWQLSGDAATFTPDRGFRPGTAVKLTIPGGSAGMHDTSGGLLAAPVTVRFRTGRYHYVRMEQLLAQLGYLPLTWSPAPGAQAAALTDANAQLRAAYQPPHGSYTWNGSYPAALQALWRPDRGSMILQGAVMAFEADHGLALDGVIGSAVWRAMFSALAKGERNPHGYTYALASQHLPETLTVWHNGRVIFKHVANTGIGVAPTAVGTSPVYLRYQYQIMKGRNPDGTKYADPVAWVSYFRAGEAVHYFPRYSYGSPQSLGCVELPYGPAKRIWPFMTFGTLVTVTAP